MKTEVKALFKDFNAGEKKDVLKFELKGDLSDSQLVALHKLKGGQVYIQISSSQMDIDDIEEDDDHPGMEYSVGRDGVVQVDSSQLSLEDVATSENAADPDELPEDTQADNESGGDLEPTSQNVADIDQERKRRGRPKKTESDTVPAEDPADKLDDLPAASSDDDLPF
ncbi:hypothetical protein P9G84_23735 [Brevibacillus centrosporus]|uniref:hypothetical protein n=1 Tax=Brevibacillus centrosporus TaxID=54910 RepID=UPI000F09CC8E|nr:hypothetical protein [Brevibacillus centrosporus]MEC2131929.1 hypothetical protein [Brevibacillus centrosporus]RNB62758.1 hypothetical protein EDM55_29805 [Brevibacillus centrosporus]GED35061.1 hypothetical protein BCE02nite_62020 [Brevibacillus centrosporus]